MSRNHNSNSSNKCVAFEKETIPDKPNVQRSIRSHKNPWLKHVKDGQGIKIKHTMCRIPAKISGKTVEFLHSWIHYAANAGATTGKRKSERSPCLIFPASHARYRQDLAKDKAIVTRKRKNGVAGVFFLRPSLKSTSTTKYNHSRRVLSKAGAASQNEWEDNDGWRICASQPVIKSGGDDGKPWMGKRHWENMGRCVCRGWPDSGQPLLAKIERDLHTKTREREREQNGEWRLVLSRMIEW